MQRFKWSACPRGGTGSLNSNQLVYQPMPHYKLPHPTNVAYQFGIVTRASILSMLRIATRD